MITSIEVQGLRGIREGRIDGLAPLTMLVGPNGCGKSTVLEACGVVCAGPSATEVFKALSAREWMGPAGVEYWVSEQGAKIVGKVDGLPNAPTAGFTSTLTIHQFERHVRSSDDEVGASVMLSVQSSEGTFQATVNADGRVISSAESARRIAFALQNAFVDRPAGATQRLTSAHFSSAHRDALTTIKLSPWYDELFSFLQVLRPNLTSIESIAVGDRDEPHLFERAPRVGYPLAYAGDGFRRALLLAGTFARAKGGVAAIDEPEAFAHPGMFNALTGLIRRAIADGTQVVLATHSLEFVAAALRAFDDQPDQAAVVGLRMEGGVLDPLVISGPDAHQRVLEFGHDLRL